MERLTYDEDTAFTLADDASTVARIARMATADQLRAVQFDEWTALEVLGHVADTAGYNEFRAPAVLYDGTSASGLSWIVHFTGLWNVWDDAARRPKTCWTKQPQVFLFGYEALAYDAQDPKVALLRVRPASGYRMVIITGPVRGTIAVVSDKRLDELVVPAAWVTPAH